MSNHLAHVLDAMVKKNLAYEPVKQTRTVLLYWRLPEEWADVLHEWVCTLLRVSLCFRLKSFPSAPPAIAPPCKATNTGQLNTILTFYEISDPPVPSALSGIPEPLLSSAIAILAKSGRAQLISISDGDGVRLFPPRSTK